jgi:two-component system NarL family response regulator
VLDEFARQRDRSALPSPGTPAPDAALSPRQIQILTLVAQGQTYREVGQTIGIAERTVKYHMAEILEQLHLRNRAQVIAFAAQMGLLRPGQDPD